MRNGNGAHVPWSAPVRVARRAPGRALCVAVHRVTAVRNRERVVEVSAEIARKVYSD